MGNFTLGDIIKVEGYDTLFLVISSNAFIKNNNVFHVSPVTKKAGQSPLHIYLEGKSASGFVSCEQIKLFDPDIRNCVVVDRISYNQIMNISDAIQGIFEYD